jgi:hypothetical protein
VLSKKQRAGRRGLIFQSLRLNDEMPGRLMLEQGLRHSSQKALLLNAWGLLFAIGRTKSFREKIVKDNKFFQYGGQD